MGKKRNEKGAGIPSALVASIGARILGEIANPIFGKKFR